MKVEAIPLDQIIEGERAREDYGDISELAETIDKDGLQQPISVIEISPGQYSLISGGRRLTAHRELRRNTIDAVVREAGSLSTVDKMELELVENVFRKDFTWSERCKLERKIYEQRMASDANWSQNKTSKLLGRARSAIHQDIELAEAIEILPELAKKETQSEAWKAWHRIKEDYHVKQTVEKQREEAKAAADTKVTPPTIRHGADSEFLHYVESKYAIGDAFEGLSKLRGIVDFMEVDPPYAVDLAQHRKKAQDKHIVSTYNELPEEGYPDWLKGLTSQLSKAMKDNSWGIFWYGSKWYPEVCKALTTAGFKINKTPAIWIKTGGGYSPQPNIHLANLYENFIVFRKGNPGLLKPGRSNVFQYAQPSSKERIHPTQRPLRLIEELLTVFTTEASIICVPFMGSGNTLRAAYNLNRIAFGWDVDSIYKDRLIAGEVRNAE